MTAFSVLLSQYSEHHLCGFIDQFSNSNKAKNAELLNQLKQVNPDLLSRTKYVQLKTFQWMLEHTGVARITLQALSVGCRVLQVAATKNFVDSKHLKYGLILPKVLELSLELVHEVAPKQLLGAVEKLRNVVRVVNRALSAAFVSVVAFKSINVPKEPSSEYRYTIEALIRGLWHLYKHGGLAAVLNFTIAMIGIFETITSVMMPSMFGLFDYLTGDKEKLLKTDLHLIDIVDSMRPVNKHSEINAPLHDKLDYWLVRLEEQQISEKAMRLASGRVPLNEEELLDALKKQLEKFTLVAKKIDKLWVLRGTFSCYGENPFNHSRCELIRAIWQRCPKDDANLEQLSKFLLEHMRYWTESTPYDAYKPLFQEIGKVNRESWHNVIVQRLQKEEQAA